MKREFPYITVGKILKELEEEASPQGEKPFKLARSSFYYLDRKKRFEGLFTRTAGNWRVATKENAEKIKQIIRENFAMV